MVIIFLEKPENRQARAPFEKIQSAKKNEKTLFCTGKSIKRLQNQPLLKAFQERIEKKVTSIRLTLEFVFLTCYTVLAPIKTQAISLQRFIMSPFRDQANFPAYRPRRLRSKSKMRELVRENNLLPSDFIWPIFVADGDDKEFPIPTMPGVCRHTVDRLPKLAKHAKSIGISSICIFPYTETSLKTEDCREAWAMNNLTNRAITKIKDAVPDILVMTDIALDPYNINGQDGIVRDGEVVNDETVDALVKMGASQVSAGADILGPSDMMDGRIGALRTMLEQNGHHNICTVSYTHLRAHET